MSIFPATIAQLKELAITGRPLLLGRFTLFDGSTTLYVSTHPLNTSEGGWQYGGTNYYARILNQEIPGLQMRSATGIDKMPSVTLKLADADRTLYTNLEQTIGFKGATLSMVLVFFAGNSNNFSTDEWLKFKGICSKPAIAADGSITVTATSTRNLSKTFLPNARFGSRCIWVFPTTAAERLDGATNPASHFFECGYCPDISGIDPIYGDSVTRGNFQSGSTPYTSCGYTKTDCGARGMLTIDSSSRATGSFGGDQWAPPSGIQLSKSYLLGKSVPVNSSRNDSIYGQPIPMVYGTGWTNAVKLNSVNEANTARWEAVFSLGQIGQVGGDIDIRGVVVDGIWVPRNGQSPDNAVFRWNPASRSTTNHIGTRRGIPTADAGFDSNGDPDGSKAKIEVVIYSQVQGNSTRILSGGQRVWAYQPIATAVGGGSSVVVTLPSGVPNRYIAGNPPYTVQIIGNSWSTINANWQLTNWTFGPPGTVTLASSALTGSGTGGYIRYLTRGIQDADGVNPAWLIMDLLTWSNFQYTDIDVASFAAEASYCDTQIAYTDITGNTSASHCRYKASVSLEQRRTADQVINAILNSFNAQLRTDITTGATQLFIRKTLADQQPAPGVDGSGNYLSNYNTAVKSMTASGSVANGYVAYRFDESTISGPPEELARDSAQVPNRINFAFQNEENQWSQDSISEVDGDDVSRAGGLGSGNEVNDNFNCEGICNFDQGIRISRVRLAENFRGNELQDTRGTRIFKLQTNYRVAHLRSGDICLLQWQQLNFRPAVQLQSPSGTNIYGILVRVLSVEDISDNFDKASVTVQWHEDIWYTDAYGQQAPPAYSDPRKSAADRAPYPWASFDSAYNPDDSLFPGWGLFDTSTSYVQATSGDAIPVVQIIGSPIVNKFSSLTNAPLVPLQSSSASSGGAIAAGTYIFGVTSVDSAGNESPMSLYTHVTIASGTTNTISIPIRTYDAGAVSFTVYGGSSELLMTQQRTCAISGLSGGAVVLVQLFAQSGTPPDIAFDHFHFRGKKETVPGVWYGPVSQVIATGIGTGGATSKIAIGATFTDNFAGYIISKINTATIGLNTQPNYTCVSSDGTYLTTSQTALMLNITGPAYTVGDIVTLRATGKIVSSNTIGDPLFINSFVPSGLTTNSQFGNNVRIIAGTGAGQEYPIISNTATTLTINGSWAVLPDSTSVFVIVQAAWHYDAVASPITNTRSTVMAHNPIGSLPLENVGGQIFFIEVLTENANGESLPEFYAPFRELYIVGDAGTTVVGTPITLTASATILATNNPVWCNATGGAFTVTLPALSSLTIPITLTKTDASANAVTVQCAGGDTINGLTAIVLDGSTYSSITIQKP